MNYFCVKICANSINTIAGWYKIWIVRREGESPVVQSVTFIYLFLMHFIHTATVFVCINSFTTFLKRIIDLQLDVPSIYLWYFCFQHFFSRLIDVQIICRSKTFILKNPFFIMYAFNAFKDGAFLIRRNRHL